jgi:HD superfamily phosphohydrolase YqeK
MNLSGKIDSAENQYKRILEEFFISVYNEKTLPSHGIDHHRRVWNYARELLSTFPTENSPDLSRLPYDLIIACYLHDIGMSVDPGIKHGRHSRDLCSRFLMEQKLSLTDFTEVLEAIEHHDNKDYSGDETTDKFRTILSVADDLDAFGCTGIFRYTEIYLTRKIGFEEIGSLIRENARKRYDNFIKSFGMVDELVVKHWERYYLLDMFFSKYNLQLPLYNFGTENPSGFCGVVEIIEYVINNNLQLKDFYTQPEKHTSDTLILWYLTELEKELVV